MRPALRACDKRRGCGIADWLEIPAARAAGVATTSAAEVGAAAGVATAAAEVGGRLRCRHPSFRRCRSWRCRRRGVVHRCLDRIRRRGASIGHRPIPRRVRVQRASHSRHCRGRRRAVLPSVPGRNHRRRLHSRACNRRDRSRPDIRAVADTLRRPSCLGD